MEVTKDDIGKRIKFRAPCRYDNSIQTRKLRGITEKGNLLVYCHGYNDFVVYPGEVIEVLE